ALRAAIRAHSARCGRVATHQLLPRRVGDGLPATIRCTCSPSVFSDSSLSASFLRTTTAKKPRTECGCQPVEVMIVQQYIPACAGAASDDPEAGGGERPLGIPTIRNRVGRPQAPRLRSSASSIGG